MKSITFGELGGLFLVAVLLLLGLRQITGLVRERKSLHQDAHSPATRSAGTGPD